MSGTKQGSENRRKSQVKRYGSWEKYLEEMHRRSAKGGKAGNTGGFHGNPELASRAGKIGGSISRRGGSVNRVRRLRTPENGLQTQ